MREQGQKRICETFWLKIAGHQAVVGGQNLNLGECRAKCSNNCSCTASANTDIREKGYHCITWFRDLIDIRQFLGASGQDLYLQLHSSEFDTVLSSQTFPCKSSNVFSFS